MPRQVVQRAPRNGAPSDPLTIDSWDPWGSSDLWRRFRLCISVLRAPRTGAPPDPLTNDSWDPWGERCFCSRRPADAHRRRESFYSFLFNDMVRNGSAGAGHRKPHGSRVSALLPKSAQRHTRRACGRSCDYIQIFAHLSRAFWGVRPTNRTGNLRRAVKRCQEPFPRRGREGQRSIRKRFLTPFLSAESRGAPRTQLIELGLSGRKANSRVEELSVRCVVSQSSRATYVAAARLEGSFLFAIRGLTPPGYLLSPLRG